MLLPQPFLLLCLLELLPNSASFFSLPPFFMAFSLPSSSNPFPLEILFMTSKSASAAIAELGRTRNGSSFKCVLKLHTITGAATSPLSGGGSQICSGNSARQQGGSNRSFQRWPQSHGCFVSPLCLAEQEVLFTRPRPDKQQSLRRPKSRPLCSLLPLPFVWQRHQQP